MSNPQEERNQTTNSGNTQYVSTPSAFGTAPSQAPKEPWDKRTEPNEKYHQEAFLTMQLPPSSGKGPQVSQKRWDEFHKKDQRPNLAEKSPTYPNEENLSQSDEKGMYTTEDVQKGANLPNRHVMPTRSDIK